MPQLRPKGLGLGADRRLLANSVAPGPSSNTENDAHLSLTKGAFVKIVSGKLRDSYGKVDAFDVDNSRVFIRLALGGVAVSVSQAAIKLVSQREYDKDSKCLNIEKYEKYKEKQVETTNGQQQQKPTKEINHRKLDSLSDRKRSIKDEKNHVMPKKGKINFWMRPDLRVRLVDEKYKKGKHKNEKVIIIDVLSRDECICKRENGSVLEGISQNMLETVIPKNDDAYVMILDGELKGQVGQILERDRSKNLAHVQLITNRNQTCRLSFDSICEYVGDVDVLDE